MKSRYSSSGFIDKRVFLIMAISSAIAIIVLAFRFKNYVPCTPAEIFVKEGPLYAGELIQFKAIANNKKESLQWDFGDNSAPITNETIVNHKFNKSGRYEVVLNTNKHCETFKTIYVLEAPIIVDESTKAVFTGPQMVEVGTPALFIDSTPNASKWEWRFGETSKVDATEQKVHYTFRTTGTKNVILTVNDKKIGELMVQVAPRTYRPPQRRPITRAPQTQAPENLTLKPLEAPLDELKEHDAKVPNYTKEDLHKMILEMVDGKKIAADLSKYFCDKQNMQITYNERQMGVDKLCEELRDIERSERVRELKIDFDSEAGTNCIKSMNVKLKRRRILGF